MSHQFSPKRDTRFARAIRERSSSSRDMIVAKSRLKIHPIGYRSVSDRWSLASPVRKIEFRLIRLNRSEVQVSLERTGMFTRTKTKAKALHDDLHPEVVRHHFRRH